MIRNLYLINLHASAAACNLWICCMFAREDLMKKATLCSLVVFAVRNPQGQIKLLCKGADTIIFDRLDPSGNDLMLTTSEHLSVSIRQLSSSIHLSMLCN